MDDFRVAVAVTLSAGVTEAVLDAVVESVAVRAVVVVIVKGSSNELSDDGLMKAGGMMDEGEGSSD